MTEALDIVALVGSLRRDSYNRRLVHAIAPLARPGLRIEIAEIADLPLYNEDDEADRRAAKLRYSIEHCSSDPSSFLWG